MLILAIKSYLPGLSLRQPFMALFNASTLSPTKRY